MGDWYEQKIWIQTFTIYVGFELIVYTYNQSGFGDLMNELTKTEIFSGRKKE